MNFPFEFHPEFMNGLDTEKVNAYLEDCIARKEPLIKVRSVQMIKTMDQCVLH